MSDEISIENNPPMGASQWRQHGQKYHYWDYFIDKEVVTELNKMKEHLKDWLEGTVYKQYDREEEALVIRDDVDRYFDGFIESLKR